MASQCTLQSAPGIDVLRADLAALCAARDAASDDGDGEGDWSELIEDLTDASGGDDDDDESSDDDDDAGEPIDEGVLVEDPAWGERRTAFAFKLASIIERYNRDFDEETAPMRPPALSYPLEELDIERVLFAEDAPPPAKRTRVEGPEGGVAGGPRHGRGRPPKRRIGVPKALEVPPTSAGPSEEASPV